jgi:hypothetical protein
VTFDDPGTTYALAGFGGCEDAAVVVDPAGGPNQVARITKSATAEVWGGTTLVSQTGNKVGKIPFAAGRTTMTLRVYAPAAGLTVMVKVEDASNSGIFVEASATTTTANAWETLTFSYAAANLASTYDRASVFPNFGTSGATAGAAQTWYVDDLTLLP